MTAFKKNTPCQLTTTTSPVFQKQKCLLNQLNCLAETLLKPQSRNTHSILPFIEQRLKQFKLSTYYDDTEILIMALERAEIKIKSGEEIVNLPNYLKGISLNIIRKLNKNRSHQYSLILRLKNRSEFINSKEYLIPEYTTESNVKALNKAFEKLTPEERRLLILREVRSLSWPEIAEYLVAIGEESEKTSQLVQRLRQKGNRTLKRLRKYYNSCQKN